MQDSLIKNTLSEIDREELTKLVMQLVDIPSPPGQEEKVASFILSWLQENGIESIRQEVESGRLNAVGILKGSGNGSNLMLNGHLDTAHGGTLEDIATIGANIALLQPKAALKDGIISGIGCANCKGGVAAALIALKALKTSRANLRGDVTVAGVCGEICVAPVDKYQGPAYHGHGYGTRYLLTHGVIPDLALVVEPSSHQLVWTLPGVLYVKVTTYGESVYMPFSNRDKWEKEGTNCIRNSIKMFEAIEGWAVEYEKRNTYESPGGTVTAKVNIGAIRAGEPFKPSYSLASCSAFVDIRVLPKRNLMEVKRELEDVLKKTGIDNRIDVYRSQKGYEGSNNEQLVDAIRAAYKHVFNTEPPNNKNQRANSWNDNNIFHEMGIPSVKFGLLPVSTSSLSKKGGAKDEAVQVDELVNMAKIYALTAISICR